MCIATSDNSVIFQHFSICVLLGVSGIPLDICVKAYWCGLDEFLCDASTTSLREIHFVNVDAEVTAKIQDHFSKKAKALSLPGFTVPSHVTSHQPVQFPHSSRSENMKFYSWD